MDIFKLDVKHCDICYPWDELYYPWNQSTHIPILFYNFIIHPEHYFRFYFPIYGPTADYLNRWVTTQICEDSELLSDDLKEKAKKWDTNHHFYVTVEPTNYCEQSKISHNLTIFAFHSFIFSLENKLCHEIIRRFNGGGRLEFLSLVNLLLMFKLIFFHFKLFMISSQEAFFFFLDILTVRKI